MAQALSMHGRKKLATLQAEFSAKFPYLTLLFLDTRREPLDPELSLAAVRTTKGEDLSIVGHMKVATFEARCVASFGIAVEVAYLKDGELVRSQAEADEKTLSGLNAWCADQGSAPVGGAKTTGAEKPARGQKASKEADEATRNETVLTEAIAAQYIADDDSVALTQFTSITEVAAATLAKSDELLWLDGLVSISDPALEALAKCRGGLSLDGLTTLSDAGARALAGHTGGSLWLQGLTKASEAALDALKEHAGDTYCPLLPEPPSGTDKEETEDEDDRQIDDVDSILRSLGSADDDDADEEDDSWEDEDDESDDEEEDVSAEPDAESRNPFEVACANGDVAAVEAMLRAGYDVNAIGPIETPALFVAVSEGSVEVVAVLLDAGADVNCQDVWAGNTPLQYALQREDVPVRMIDLLLARGSTLNPDEEQTLLQAIATTGRMDLVEVAVAHGADLLADGFAAAQEAARQKQWELANGLAQRIAMAGGATLPEVTPDMMAWLEAAAAGQTDSLHLLHDRIDVNGADIAGQTALHLAVAGGHLDAVTHLLEWGADPNRQDARGEAPINRIHFAYAWDIESMVAVLLVHGADATTADADGRTPAHHAFAHPSLMKRLLEAGADGRAASRWGDTPLHWCASNYIQDDDDASRRLLVAKALIAQDAGLTHVRDTDGRTAWVCFVEQDAQERISTDAYFELFRLFAGTDTLDLAASTSDQIEAVTITGAEHERLTELRPLLSDTEPSSIVQALSLAGSLDDRSLWEALASGVSIGRNGQVRVATGSVIAQTITRHDLRDLVAWSALRGAGRLDDLEELAVWQLGSLEWIRELPKLRSLTMNFCSTLQDVEACRSLPALERIHLNACGPLAERFAQAGFASRTVVHEWDADRFFNDLSVGGPLFDRLAEHGLIRRAFDQVALGRLSEHFVDLVEDGEFPTGTAAVEATRLPLFVVDVHRLRWNNTDWSDSAVHATVEALQVFEPLSHVQDPDAAHFYDLLFVDAATQIIVALGLGRKCRSLVDASVRGGDFQRADDSVFGEMSPQPINLLSSWIEIFEETFSNVLYEDAHLPSLDALESALADGADEEGTYSLDGEALSEDEVRAKIAQLAEIEESKEEESRLFQIYFPDFHADSLQTYDF